ncbi:hypothetical protein C7447_10665 [Tenacibaculum adriaticum]|uniref:Adenylosuccinate lyase n=1 Tax=Tenacibaculum adriaticum TaxID=413713 RepID=A0A5S5DP05_9FLAO|nr:adenylosuccinate lyase [Tenacibaculum adriaticum]TYP96766.1 hypothetical protein C7447_10665 [Tenacibaculum adriaticum]
MNQEFLNTILIKVENAKRKNRDAAAKTILKTPTLFPYLVSTTFQVDTKLSVRAAWILEWICTHNGLDLLLPHLEEFTKNIHKVHFDGSVRTCAKICKHIATAYTSKNSHKIKNVLTNDQIERIIETGFDWLITNQKIAVKAYTMNTLYLFGLQKDWIHPELEHIIRNDVIHQSKGCEARGRKILKLIQNFNQKKL